MTNGEFDGADYILTSSDKIEIAKLVEPLAESMHCLAIIAASVALLASLAAIAAFSIAVSAALIVRHNLQ